ncbi:MAG: hypothetical protein LBQ33_07065 [Oscillospiraceae bacterium]|jgi:vacuolar-type H+-ATPase subunit H|nr:hypothetical protein [Oscillospiraceae bacterium]
MTDNVDRLLLQLQEQIESGKKLGRLRIVDPALLQDILDSIHSSLPTVIEKAKEVVAQRGEVFSRARAEAEATVAQAQQRAGELEAHTNERVQEVVLHAKKRVEQARAEGEQIIAQAEAEAARLVQEHSITAAAQEHAEQMLRQARAAAEKIEAESRQSAEQLAAHAQGYSQDLRRRTEEWGLQYTSGVRNVVEEIVNEAEDILSSSLSDIRDTKKRLQVTMTKSATAPEFQSPEQPF